jgi:hypothetical protein
MMMSAKTPIWTSTRPPTIHSARIAQCDLMRARGTSAARPSLSWWALLRGLFPNCNRRSRRRTFQAMEIVRRRTARPARTGAWKPHHTATQKSPHSA